MAAPDSSSDIVCEIAQTADPVAEFVGLAVVQAAQDYRAACGTNLQVRDPVVVGHRSAFDSQALHSTHRDDAALDVDDPVLDIYLRRRDRVPEDAIADRR